MKHGEFQPIWPRSGHGNPPEAVRTRRGRSTSSARMAHLQPPLLLIVLQSRKQSSQTFWRGI
ncbi:MAG UNVERIFIED_CONTAM: hypothetical protein LVR18_26360 [Planctomycetaceae bacterium]